MSDKVHIIKHPEGEFCYYCKDYFFSSKEYLVQYASIPGVKRDGRFSWSSEWICCCEKCQPKLKDEFEVLEERDFIVRDDQL